MNANLTKVVDWLMAPEPKTLGGQTVALITLIIIAVVYFLLLATVASPWGWVVAIVGLPAMVLVPQALGLAYESYRERNGNSKPTA